MSRAHIYRLMVDAEGNTLTGLTVRVLQPGTTTVIADPLYVADTGSTTRSNPYTSADGAVDFYLDTPQRVRLGVAAGSSPEVYYEDIDVLNVPETFTVDAEGVNFAPAGSLSSTNVQDALEELDAEKYGPDNPPPSGFDPSGAGSNSTKVSGTVTSDAAALADGDSSSAYGVGSWARGFGDTALGADSQTSSGGQKNTVIGVLAKVLNTGVRQSVSIGYNARTGGWYNIAIGENAATGTQDRSIAIGQNAVGTAADATAVGQRATATSAGGTAIGARSFATGVGATAVGGQPTTSGYGANAETTQTTAIGSNSNATRTDATAIGYAADARHLRAVALGSGATAPADDTGVVKVDEFEVMPSSGGSRSRYSQHSVNGTKVYLATIIEEVNIVPSAGAAQTVPSPEIKSLNRYVLDADCTFTFPTLVSGMSFTVVLVQDSTGGHTVTWPSNVDWGDAGEPVISSAGNKGTVVSFMCDYNASGLWLGFLGGKGFGS